MEPLDEQSSNYLTHNPSISESSKSYARYFVHSLFTSELTARPLDGRGTKASRQSEKINWTWESFIPLKA